MSNATRADRPGPRPSWWVSAAAAAALAAGPPTAHALARGRQAEGAAITVATQPAGASVSVDDGSAQPAPATFANLAPGTHMVSARMEGFADARRSVSLLAGQTAAVNLSLAPLLGLVLIHSQPQGADVSMNGAYKGKTPLLVPDFPLGQHRLIFSLHGYADKEIELNVRDRTPVKVDVELASQSSRIVLTSTPPGASVQIDGVPRGATPCTLEHLAGETVKVEIVLPRFEPYVEAVPLVAGQSYQLAPVLRPLPGKIRIVSVPPGARAYVNDELRGETPVEVPGLRAGQHRLRVERAGFDQDARVVEIQPAEESVQEFRLVRNSGTLVVATIPPGVDVYVDGELKGTTKAAEIGQASEPLTVDYIPQGEHTLQLSRKGFAFRPRPFSMESDKIVQVHEQLTRLFIPDTVIVHSGGTAGGQYELTGVLVKRHENGDVDLEVRPGVTMKITADAIVATRPIKTDEK